jgi:hypothetical protein
MNNSQHIIVNNIEELLIKEYYSKYLLVSKKNNIYDKEILRTYSNIYSPNRWFQ